MWTSLGGWFFYCHGLPATSATSWFCDLALKPGTYFLCAWKVGIVVVLPRQRSSGYRWGAWNHTQPLACVQWVLAVVTWASLLFWWICSPTDCRANVLVRPAHGDSAFWSFMNWLQYNNLPGFLAPRPLLYCSWLLLEFFLKHQPSCTFRTRRKG